MKRDGDYFIFEDGEKFYASYYLGIRDDLDIAGGYDQALIENPKEWAEEDHIHLTKERRRELADYVINLWQQWAEKEDLWLFS